MVMKIQMLQWNAKMEIDRTLRNFIGNRWTTLNLTHILTTSTPPSHCVRRTSILVMELHRRVLHVLEVWWWMIMTVIPVQM